ncbi:hypothetical protein AOLI_G00075570 [Acnodon oligacanthus]
MLSVSSVPQPGLGPYHLAEAAVTTAAGGSGRPIAAPDASGGCNFQRLNVSSKDMIVNTHQHALVRSAGVSGSMNSGPGLSLESERGRRGLIEEISLQPTRVINVFHLMSSFSPPPSTSK